VSCVNHSDEKLLGGFSELLLRAGKEGRIGSHFLVEKEVLVAVESELRYSF